MDKDDEYEQKREQEIISEGMQWVTRMSIREELRKEFEQKAAKNEGKKTGIPRLKVESAQKYIAAVSLAVLRRDIEPAMANTMLYAAQLLLAASKIPTEKKERKKRLEKSNVIEGSTL